jgi:phage tail-like protein
MTDKRMDPYRNFNFRVTIVQGGDSFRFSAAFHEISGLEKENTPREQRDGKDLEENHTRKISGINKSTNVTLKRGVVASTDLNNWLKESKRAKKRALRSVIIELMDEGLSVPVKTWRLSNARPIRYTGPVLNAKSGGDVAIEELVLSCERIE